MKKLLLMWALLLCLINLLNNFSCCGWTGVQVILLGLGILASIGQLERLIEGLQKENHD